MTPAARREAAAYLQAAFAMSERQACRVIGVDRSSVRYRASKPDDGVLRERLKVLAQERRRFGYRRLHVLLRREGHAVNKKRVQRLYREEKLTVRRCGGHTRAVGTRVPIGVPLRPDERGSLDFVSDQMTDGRRFRILAVVDDCTRECLALVPDTSVGSPRRPGTRRHYWPARPAHLHRQRQRNGVQLEPHPGLGGAQQGQVALHRARQAAAERLHRELQRPDAGRGAQRHPVPLSGPCPGRAGRMAARLQRASAAFQARLADAERLCRSPIRKRRP